MKDLNISEPSKDENGKDQTIRSIINSELSKPQNSNLIGFLRAYLIGYGVEVIPLIIKSLIIQSIKLTQNLNKNEEGSGKIYLIYCFKSLIQKVFFKNFIKGFRVNGLALAAGLTIGGGRILEYLIVKTQIKSLIKSLRPLIRKLKKLINAIRRRNVRFENSAEGKTSEGEENDEDLTGFEKKLIDRLSTFFSASISSLIAITILQNSTRNNLIRSREKRNFRISQSVINPTTTPYPTLESEDYLKRNRTDSSKVLIFDQEESKSTLLRQSPTLDFTLFFVVRALDTIIRSTYDNYAPKYLNFLRSSSESILFQLCCWRIMYCWFYDPSRLPMSYIKWISKLSAMDQSLLELIRLGKSKRIEYGSKCPTEEVKNLGRSIAERMGRDGDLGDIEVLDRFPCELIHGRLGNSRSCSVNVTRRMVKAWKQAMGIYLPVFTVPTILFNRSNLINSPLSTILKILKSSSRSSLFLSSFIGLCWSGICVGRSMRMKAILEKFFFSNNYIFKFLRLNKGWAGKGKRRELTMMYMDTVIGPQIGSFLAGLSILIENPKRRGEMTLYVIMRALCSSVDEIFPRKIPKTASDPKNYNSLTSSGNSYRRKCLNVFEDFLFHWFERFLFSISIGTITSAVVHQPDYVRGIVKGIIKFTIGDSWVDKKLD